MFCNFRQAIQSAGRKLHNGKPQKVHFGESGPAGDVPKATLPIQMNACDIIGSICGPDGSFNDLASSLVPQGSMESWLGFGDGEESTESAHSDLTYSTQNFDSLRWDNATHQLSGLSVSLYDVNPITGLNNGDPIADCFGAIQYEDGAILACADGCNWGAKPKLAARCAVYASLRSLHTALSKHPVGDSTRMFSLMLQAVLCAQQTIIQREGSMTTLVLTVVARSPALKSRYAVMTVSVGDCAALTFSATSGDLTDLTAACRQDLARDPRNCQGALGFAMGEAPDLGNMTLSLSTAAPGDLLILASDGVIDNFDPVMRKEAVLVGGASHIQQGVELRVIYPHDAHLLTVDLMRRTLRRAFDGGEPGARPLVSAPGAVQTLLGEAAAITEDHRATIVRCSRKSAMRRRTEEDIFRELMQARGKLDHATALAFQCP